MSQSKIFITGVYRKEIDEERPVLTGLFCGVWREFEGEKGERAKN